MSALVSDDTSGVKTSTALKETVLCFLISVAIWSVGLLFLITKNEYVSFAIVFCTVALVEIVRRVAPQAYDVASDVLVQKSRVFGMVSLVSLALIPFLMQEQPYWIHVLTIVFIYGIAAQGLNIHLGETGAINIGYAGLFAIGAYVTALSVVDGGTSFWIGLAYAVLACWLVGFLVGVCTIKTTGDYLSLVTMGFGLIVYQLSVNMTWLTHGTDGVHVPKPTLFTHRFDYPIDLGLIHLPKEANFYYLALICLLGAMAISRRMINSWIGRTWAAMRQDPLGAGCFGVNVPSMRIFSFAFGSAFAGVAGGLYGGEIGFIEPSEFTLFMSITLICMVILGGMGNWWGVVVGAFIMIVVPEKLRDFQEMRYFLYGIVLLLILIYRPFGLFASVRRKHEKLIG